jgi:hypothetical protein
MACSGRDDGGWGEVGSNPPDFIRGYSGWTGRKIKNQRAKSKIVESCCAGMTIFTSETVELRLKERMMANRGYLLVVDDRSTTWSKDPEKEIIAEGINEVPVFWASLFVAGDRQIDVYEGEEGDLKIANWCVETRIAKERLKRLKEPIGGLLDLWSRKIWNLWIDYLSQQDGMYFKTNTAEVWDLCTERYDSYWSTLLLAFSNPTELNFQMAAESNDLRYMDRGIRWDNHGATICKLAGAEHIRDLPWFKGVFQDWGMSWDLYVQELPEGMRSMKEIVEDFRPGVIGKRSEIVRTICEAVPGAVFSDPTWGIIDGPGYKIHVGIDEAEECDGFCLHVCGREEVVAVVDRILGRLGMRALNPRSESGVYESGQKAIESFRQSLGYEEPDCSKDGGFREWLRRWFGGR